MLVARGRRAGRLAIALLAACVLALAGCGGDEGDGDGDARGAADPPATTTTAERTDRDGAGSAAPAEEGAPAPPPGTRIVAGDSEFGRMLFDGQGRALYIFENDPRDETVCYGRCARDWPPALTRGRPRDGAGVDAALLGTVRRRDGTRQVTYAGRPLYRYAHEAPGEVRCHDVHLNGGFWWVMGPDGERRP